MRSLLSLCALITVNRVTLITVMDGFEFIFPASIDCAPGTNNLDFDHPGEGPQSD